MLQIVGTCDQRIYGLTPAERLKRQRGETPGPTIIASATAVLGDAAVAWLLENPASVLRSEEGRALAVAVEAPALDPRAALMTPSGRCATASAIGKVFIRKLRRRDTLFARSIEEHPVHELEKQLFDSVYKGVTDLVTKYVWPLPAFWVTRALSRVGVHPNAVTSAGILAMLAATLLWAQGEILAGLLLAWLMTFLDTVDGKLARVTVRSSKLGDVLDHATDVIHPPIWWLALAFGLADQSGAQTAPVVWSACAVILAGYVAGRMIELLFKARFGFNSYLWRPFDSVFRLIVSRRNVVLLIVTVGLFAGAPAVAFATAAAWTAVSVAIQLVRLLQAQTTGRDGPVVSWLT